MHKGHPWLIAQQNDDGCAKCMISQHGIQPKNVCMLLTFGVTAATTTSHISRVTTLAQKMLFDFCKKSKKTHMKL